MKVLFEATPIYYSTLKKSAKTGIFRVVDELLKQLLLMDDLELFPFIYECLQIDDKKIEDLYKLNIGQYLSNDMIWDYRSKGFNEVFIELYKNRKSNDYKNKIDKLLKKSLYKLLKIYKGNKNFILDESKYDLCHITLFNDYSNLSRIKKLVTIYDLVPVLYPELISSPAVNENFIKLMNQIDDKTWISCISESTRVDLLSNFKNVDPDKTFVNHLAPSNDIKYITDPKAREVLFKKHKINSNDKYLLSVSTIEPRKNMASVVKAFSILAEDPAFDQIKILMVGDKGWNVDKLFSDISLNKKISDRIIFTGFIDNYELSVIYSNALAFIYPSLYEGFGIPPLEAMKCNVPVITSNVSSLPEVVGDAAITVSPLDIDEIADSMRIIIENGAVRDSLIEKGLMRVQGFSWERYGKEICGLYNNIISY